MRYQLDATDAGVFQFFDGPGENGSQAYVPNAPGNSDWQDYQSWLTAGGVPDPYPVPLASPHYSWGPTLFEAVGGQFYVGT